MDNTSNKNNNRLSLFVSRFALNWAATENCSNLFTKEHMHILLKVVSLYLELSNRWNAIKYLRIFIGVCFLYFNY